MDNNNDDDGLNAARGIIKAVGFTLITGLASWIGYVVFFAQ